MPLEMQGFVLVVNQLEYDLEVHKTPRNFVHRKDRVTAVLIASLSGGTT